MHECPYCKKLEAYNFGDYLGKTEHWIIFLAPNQSNLGTCVIALTRHHPTLTGLSNEEWEEFIELVEKMENAVKKAFQATLVPHGECSLNSPFHPENNPDPHLTGNFNTPQPGTRWTSPDNSFRGPPLLGTCVPSPENNLP